METDKEKLERLIKDELDSIEKLLAKKRDIDKYIDMRREYMEKYTERLNYLDNKTN